MDTITDLFLLLFCFCTSYDVLMVYCCEYQVGSDSPQEAESFHEELSHKFLPQLSDFVPLKNSFFFLVSAHRQTNITGDPSKKDLRWTQKPIYSSIFTNNIWFYLLSSSVIEHCRYSSLGKVRINGRC